MDGGMDKMITMSPFGNEDDYVLLGSVIPPKTVIISDYSQYDTSAFNTSSSLHCENIRYSR